MAENDDGVDDQQQTIERKPESDLQVEHSQELIRSDPAPHYMVSRSIGAILRGGVAPCYQARLIGVLISRAVISSDTDKRLTGI